MKITIELDDDRLKQEVTKIIAQQFYKDMGSEEKSMLSRAVKSAVLDVVYKDKPALLEACVDRAYKEITRKALPVLYERFDNEIAKMKGEDFHDS